MPSGDIYTHESGGFIVQTGIDPTKDIRMAKTIEEARLIKQQALAIQQQATERQGVVESSATPEGKAAIQAIGQQAQAEFPSNVGKLATEIGPSLVASAAMGGVGAAVPKLGSGLLGLLSRSGAQGGAELIRQRLKGEEADIGQAGTAAGISAGLDATLAAGAGLTKGLAGKSPGVMARVSEAEKGKALSFVKSNNLVVDKAGVQAAYQAFDDIIAKQGAANVNLTSTKKALNDVIKHLELSPDFEKSSTILGIFKKLQKGQSLREGTGIGPQFTGFDDVAALNTHLNAALEQAKTPTAKRFLNEAKRAMYEDIDNATIPISQKMALQKATRLAREAFAKGDLNEAISSGITTSNITGAQVINPKTILDHIQELRYTDKLTQAPNKLFAESFKPGELDKVEKFFVNIAQKLRGTSAEGTAIVLGATGGAAGSAAGKVLGAEPGLSAALGAAGAVSLPQMFTQMALNPTGAKLVVEMMGSGKPVSRPILLALMNAFVAKKSSE
jgi:hypothetical protein